MRFAGFGCALLLLSCSVDPSRPSGAAPGTPDTPDREVLEAASSIRPKYRNAGGVRFTNPVPEEDSTRETAQPQQYLTGFGLLNLTLGRGTITPVFCDTLTFQRDAFGAPISPGADVTLSYEDAGVLVTALEPDTLAAGVPIAFDSSNPTGADLDLGTPNEIYGGPGVGCAGQSNDRALGNLLIKAQNECQSSGAWLEFEFAEEKCVARADLIDIDDAQYPARVRFYGPQDTFITEIEVGGLGDNSVEHASFDVCGVRKLKFGLHSSAALHDVVVCDEPEPTVDVSFDVDLNNLVALEFNLTLFLDDGNAITKISQTRTSIDPARAIRGGSLSAILVASSAVVPTGLYGALRVEISDVEAIGFDRSRIDLPGSVSKVIDQSFEVRDCGSTHVVADWTIDARIEGDLFGIGIGLGFDNASAQQDLTGCP